MHPSHASNYGGEELDAFVLRQRRAPYTRLLLLSLAILGSAAAWSLIGGRLSTLLAPEAELLPDDPRLLVSVPAHAPDAGQLTRLRWVFSEQMPDYLETLRRFKLQKAATAAVIDTSPLDDARDRLTDAVSGDTPLATIVQSLITLGETAHASSSNLVQAQLEALNLLLQSRGLPLVARGELVTESGVALLTLRFYERVGTERYLLAGQTTTVPFLDRLDAVALLREAEGVSLDEREPGVLVRAVLTEASASLLPALHEGGAWRLAYLTPGVKALQEEESLLGTQVWEEWTATLARSLPPRDLELLASLSARLAQRNTVARSVNDRDPNRLSLPDPPAIAGPTVGRWLKRLEPYAVQGRSRLKLEDLVQLRQLDGQIAAALKAAERPVQALLKHQLQLAGASELMRARLRPLVIPLWPDIPASLGNDAAQQITREVAAQLTRAIVGAPTCRTVVASLASHMIDGLPLDQLGAQLALEALSPGKAARGIDGLAARLADLRQRPCLQIAETARSAYARHFGPYPPLEWQPPPPEARSSSLEKPAGSRL